LSVAAERQLGPWRITDKLGRGGNGTVWRAEHVETGDEAALKEVHTRKVDREPYRRFITEIETLQKLGDFPGILPLLDAHIPLDPKDGDGPWFVMPLAEPLSTALGADLEVVVACFAAIARTLASLQADHGIAHRDIKPANLYRSGGETLIGDFGLVALPDPSGLTKEGKPLGPANFIPFEMLNRPVDADPFAADAYSFAKSLWVLAAGVDYPPPGHQPADAAPYRIADYRPHPNAERLDQLVDRATRLDPGGRPSTADLAAELETWLELPMEQTDFDFAEAAAALRERLSGEIDHDAKLDRWKDDAHAAARRLEELCRPLSKAMKDADPRAELGVNDELVNNYLATPRHSGSPDVLFHFTRATKITVGTPPIFRVLRMGRGVELIEGGELIIRTMIDLGLDGVMQNDLHWEGEPRVVPVGSVRQDAALQEATIELGDQLKVGLRTLVDVAGSD
jgi:serine/threonine protein kinase